MGKEKFEFKVTCQKCGCSDWIYGTEQDEEDYGQSYVCLKCQEKLEFSDLQKKNSKDA